MKLIDTTSMKEAERRADASGLSYYQMMENAGQAAVSLLAGRYSLPGRRVCLLCGKGNNGGDALVMARLLAEAGAQVCLYLTDGVPRTAEAKQALQNLAGAVSPTPLKQVPQGETFDLLVDGVYGTGFRGELDPFHRDLFAWARGAAPFVLALDIPSGVEADTGLVAGGALRADLTAAFAAAKQAALLRPGREWMGECAVLDIGIEEGQLADLTRRVEMADEGYLRAQLSPLSPLSHKGTNGRLAAVCGSDLYRGAAALAAEAALRTGIGYLTLCSTERVCQLVSLRSPETVLCPLSGGEEGQLSPGDLPALWAGAAGADALLVGPGLGRSEGAGELVGKLLEGFSGPVLVDADGLYHLARHPQWLAKRQGATLLTPHLGEMARLTGESAERIAQNPLACAAHWAAEWGAVVLLKGHNTAIAGPDGALAVNPTGGAGLAKAGSGDTLSGILAALLVQGTPPFAAAVCAAWLHGRAGDLCQAGRSARSTLPRDLPGQLGEIFAQLGI
ncbi:NAD(P)H-hydrate dehydratase [Bittarella massiliensis (ex Durand et al. 2017)]|uniref:NAD(P)H-hydrate dehydratase n=1 Tax=Bittarella massiliensis (ex Durand et al. 2017) TaxID=1720313 RepID=UPI001AA1A228|nr:NAD(P)H-hydrate dehydratase [Bittarella massiliensis (ex Durand et al. 2017)]